MAVNGIRPDHTVFCPNNCSVKHNEMIIALSGIADACRNPPDLGALKVALYSHLQTGWNAQSNVPDALAEFRFPLVQWACVLGRTQALSWLLTKMKFKAFVVAERTGETGLHRAVRLLHLVRSRDATPRSVEFISNQFSLVLYTLTEQDPHGLFIRDKVQGNSAFHICALCITQQGSINSELEYYENCMKILLERLSSLQTMEKLPRDALKKAINLQNDRGDSILHILSRSNVSVKTVRYLLSDYHEILYKFTKNGESQTPLDVARDRKADLVEKVILDSAGLGVEQLARKYPDLYQLYTQDNVEEASYTATTVLPAKNSDHNDSTARGQLDKADDVYKGYSLRLTSFLPREGFYRQSPSQGILSSDDNCSQDEMGHSPSLLENTPVSCISPTISSSEIVNCSHSNVKNDSQQSVSTSALTQNSCVSVTVENSVLINLQEDETDDEDHNVVDVPCVVNCAIDSLEVNVPYSSNTLDENSQFSESVLPLDSEGVDVPESTIGNIASQEQDMCSEQDESSLAREDGSSSSLAKIIREESDVASMLVARLQDKKELNRAELRRAQRELTEKQAREKEASSTLQQLQAELKNVCTQKENLGRRRKELLEELKSIEGNISQLQEESVALQSRVNDQASITESFRKDREKAGETCACLKRKFTEYSQALSDISSSWGESTAKKERYDDE